MRRDKWEPPLMAFGRTARFLFGLVAGTVAFPFLYGLLGMVWIAVLLFPGRWVLQYLLPMQAFVAVVVALLGGWRAGAGFVLGAPVFLAISPFLATAVDAYTEFRVEAAKRQPLYEHTLLAVTEPPRGLVLDTDSCNIACAQAILQGYDLTYVANWYDSVRPRLTILEDPPRPECGELSARFSITRREKFDGDLPRYLRKNAYRAGCLSEGAEFVPGPYLYIRFRWFDRLRAFGPRGNAVSVEEFSAEHPDGRLLGRWEEGYYPDEIRRYGEKFDLATVLTKLLGPPRGDGA
jgi:hypothetical protein